MTCWRVLVGRGAESMIYHSPLIRVSSDLHMRPVAKETRPAIDPHRGEEAHRRGPLPTVGKGERGKVRREITAAAGDVRDCARC